MGTFAMLKYGRNAKMTFCVFIGHERKKLLGASLFSLGETLRQNLVVVIFLPTSLRKGYFLRRRLKRYQLLIAEIAVWMVFDIRLHASSRISMRNRFVYDRWV